MWRTWQVARLTRRKDGISKPLVESHAKGPGKCSGASRRPTPIGTSTVSRRWMENQRGEMARQE
jgi:hypothetical protein